MEDLYSVCMRSMPSGHENDGKKQWFARTGSAGCGSWWQSRAIPKQRSPRSARINKCPWAAIMGTGAVGLRSAQHDRFSSRFCSTWTYSSNDIQMQAFSRKIRNPRRRPWPVSIGYFVEVTAYIYPDTTHHDSHAGYKSLRVSEKKEVDDWIASPQNATDVHSLIGQTALYLSIFKSFVAIHESTTVASCSKVIQEASFCSL